MKALSKCSLWRAKGKNREYDMTQGMRHGRGEKQKEMEENGTSSGKEKTALIS